MDKLPQEQLVMELRAAIDAVRDRPLFFVASGNTRRTALVRLQRLVEENPRSVRSRHVSYNLGLARAAWLDRLIDESGWNAPHRYCQRGHSNWRTKRNGRYCVTCSRERDARRRGRHFDAALETEEAIFDGQSQEGTRTAAAS